MNADSYHAMIRFGLGRRGSEPVPDDARGWLLAQLATAGPAPIVPSTEDGLQALRFDRENKPAPEDRLVPPLVRTGYKAVLAHAIETDQPFRERLVWFWANHFAVSVRQGGCAPVACAFMQEAIRPHVTGNFTDMLLAVMQHPAMLLYLDNTGSVGPDSDAGQRSHRGLNENLARECMELHTVSPAAGYTQADVTAFANILTGWSIETKQEPLGYRFRPRAHQPGEQVVLGRRFPEGEEGGIAALRFLATHPSTYTFLATKLARHFIADNPPQAAVAAIAGALRATQGDLAAATLTLVKRQEAWNTKLGKLRSPQDYALAVLRAADLPEDKRPELLGILGSLGQPLFNPPLPNGWPDTANDWAAPEAMLRRIDWAYGFTGRLQAMEADAMADATLGPLLTPATAESVHRAGSRRDALTLLLTSPEFQRR
jgi:uncharacterized protein (DUF1800 family)